MTFKQSLKSFWHPRFTTEEIDRTYLKDGSKFEIVSLLYEDDMPHFPSRIIGRITTKLRVVHKVVWNEYGECYLLGNRIDKFDLVHPEQAEIDSAKIVMIGIIGILFTLLCSILWN